MSEFFKILLFAFLFMALKLIWIALITLMALFQIVMILIALFQIVVTLGWIAMMTLMIF